MVPVDFFMILGRVLPNYRPGDFGAFVGADSIRPVVSPMGKQRRRIAPTMAQSNIFKRNLAISCQNMEYLQHCYISRPIWFCPKICNVGGRLIAAPTRSVPPNHRAEISMRCAAMYRVSTLYRQIPSANVRYSNCRRFAPTLFPQWGNNRADDIRPYTDCATELPMQILWGAPTSCDFPARIPFSPSNVNQR